MNEHLLNEARDHIAGFVKSNRTKAGLTQQQLADDTGMDVGTISRMELGKYWPGMKQFILICNALRLDYKTLFDYE